MAEIWMARGVSFNGFGEILSSISSKTVAIAVLASLIILSVVNNLQAKSVFWSATVRICSDIKHGKVETESVDRRKESEDGVDFQCVICLCEVCEGDVYRLLPKCSHGFHASCIDAWLQTHSTCPLCRCPVPYASVKNTADQDQHYFMDTILSHLHRFLNHLCTWFVNPLGFDQQLNSTFTDDYRSVL